MWSHTYHNGGVALGTHGHAHNVLEVNHKLQAELAVAEDDDVIGQHQNPLGRAGVGPVDLAYNHTQ